MEHVNANNYHKVFLSKIMYVTLILFCFYSVSKAETICLEDSESGYRCFEMEYVHSIEELSQPMLRKEKIDSKSNKKSAITSTEELYKRAKELARELTRKSDKLNSEE